MAKGRWRGFRGPGTRSKHFDGDTFDGIGESLRQCENVDDEGDEAMRQLIARLNDIHLPKRDEK